MGKIGTVVVLLGVGTGVVDAVGAPPEAAAPANAPAKTAAPAPPVEYLRQGARLFNTRQYESAAKYLEFVQKRRDALTENERIVLDAYLDALNTYQKQKARAPLDSAIMPAAASIVEPAAPARSAPRPASATGDTDVAPIAPFNSALPDPGSEPAMPAPPAQPAPVQPSRAPARLMTTNLKQKARWLLHEAHEQIYRGEFDEALKKVAEAKVLDVHWGRFEDTPTRVTKAIAEARAKALKASKAQGANIAPTKTP